MGISLTIPSHIPFPLHSLLALYSRAHAKDVYIGQMEGFKLLVSWLSPIAFPTNTDTIPTKIYKLWDNYDIQTIAQILRVDAAVIRACMLYNIEGFNLWTPDYSNSRTLPI